jgi:hypothetical protein
MTEQQAIQLNDELEGASSQHFAALLVVLEKSPNPAVYFTSELTRQTWTVRTRVRLRGRSLHYTVYSI